MFEFLKDHIPVSRKKYKKLLIDFNEEKCRIKQLEQENDMLIKFQNGENCVGKHCRKCKYGYIDGYSGGYVYLGDNRKYITRAPQPKYRCTKKVPCKEFELKREVSKPETDKNC